jgi:hypothetical protein
MDLFLNRKPKAQILTTDQEKNLFLKRQILSNYYNTLRDYKNIPDYNKFKNIYFGSKSYADRVYNQQFQGTLKIIRRLFAITLSDVENPRQDKVVKYDQPLYNEFKYKNTPILHEELAQHGVAGPVGSVLLKDKPNRADSLVQKEKLDSSISNPTEQSSSWSPAPIPRQDEAEMKKYKKYRTNSKESAAPRQSNRAGYGVQKETLDAVKFQPFIKLENPIPLYAGWDNDLRRFVITNRLLPRKTQIPAETEIQSSNKKFYFSAWPRILDIQTENTEKISQTINSRIENGKRTSVFAFIPLNDIKYKDIKEIMQEEMSTEEMDYETNLPAIDTIDNLPPNAVALINRIRGGVSTEESGGLDSVIPTNRGGWLWPGTETFQFNVKQKFSTLFLKNWKD